VQTHARDEEALSGALTEPEPRVRDRADKGLADPDPDVAVARRFLGVLASESGHSLDDILADGDVDLSIIPVRFLLADTIVVPPAALLKTRLFADPR
jgi:hypothetical protein